jgi:hypothetical protein
MCSRKNLSPSYYAGQVSIKSLLEGIADEGMEEVRVLTTRNGRDFKTNWLELL